MLSTYQMYEKITLQSLKANHLAVLDGRGFALSTNHGPHPLAGDAHGACCGIRCTAAAECPLLDTHDLEVNDAHNVSPIRLVTATFEDANMLL